MAADFLNPMLGLDLTDEQKKMMLARALLSGGAATVGAASQPGMQPYGAGAQALMGSLDSQQQMALMAQMQAFNRKNMESQMQARTSAQEMAQKQYDLEAEREERMGKQQERQLGLEEKRISIAERQANMRAQEGQRNQQILKNREMETESFLGSLPEPTNDEQRIARELLRNRMLYGGAMPSQAGNVLMPSGKNTSLMDQILGAQMMGGMQGNPLAGAAPAMQAQQNPKIQQVLQFASPQGMKVIDNMAAVDARQIMKEIEGLSGEMGPEERMQAEAIYQALRERIKEKERKGMIGIIQR